MASVFGSLILHRATASTLTLRYSLPVTPDPLPTVTESDSSGAELESPPDNAGPDRSEDVASRRSRKIQLQYRLKSGVSLFSRAFGSANTHTATVLPGAINDIALTDLQAATRYTCFIKRIRTRNLKMPLPFLGLGFRVVLPN